MSQASATRPVTLLIADDDADDRMMIREAIEENRMQNDVRFVNDGAELLEYLRRQGKYSNPAHSPLPGLILLDLNMPKVDGRTALREIKQDPSLRQIPIVVLTTSKAEEDVSSARHLGVDSFVTKPVTFSALVEMIRDLGRYWFQIVDIPVKNSER